MPELVHGVLCNGVEVLLVQGRGKNPTYHCQNQESYHEKDYDHSSLEVHDDESFSYVNKCVFKRYPEIVHHFLIKNGSSRLDDESEARFSLFLDKGFFSV
jgi:hypothetical protein